MLRQLFAFLALITGFAALYTPAQAAVASSTNVEVQRTTEAEQGTQSVDAACLRRQKAQRLRGETPSPCASKPVVIYLPTVQLGPDRARE